MEEEPTPRGRGIRWLFCCGAPPGERKPRERKPKRERRAHRRRHRHRAQGAGTPQLNKAQASSLRSDHCPTSILSGVPRLAVDAALRACCAYRTPLHAGLARAAQLHKRDGEAA